MRGYAAGVPVDLVLARTDADHREESTQMAYPRNAADAGVPASPSLPEVERRVLDYWANDKTFVASVEAREAGPTGPTSTSSTTARRSRTGCPTTGTC